MPKSSTKRLKEPFNPALDAPVALTPRPDREGRRRLRQRHQPRAWRRRWRHDGRRPADVAHQIVRRVLIRNVVA